ncbi:MAG: hypothetical protein JRJ14_10855, partial [Deltaproteobacteria bacterium]|nr:hypothetical protein [Deltaproteobacteria bacterium]
MCTKIFYKKAVDVALTAVWLFGVMLLFWPPMTLADENASNPLAAVTNTDLRAQYFDLDGPERYDYWVDGAAMLTPKLKLKYELHYWDTDVTGSSKSDFESLHLKPIYFP